MLGLAFPAFAFDAVQFLTAFAATLGLTQVFLATGTALNIEVPLALSAVLRFGIIEMIALRTYNLFCRIIFHNQPPIELFQRMGAIVTVFDRRSSVKQKRIFPPLMGAS